MTNKINYIVQFARLETRRIGTCYSEQDCQNRGGIKAGSCANGFGFCCVFIATIGPDNDVTQNGTYVVAPEQISDTNCGNLCVTIIRKCSTDVCALRLDFVAFNTLGPANTQEFFTLCRDNFQINSVI